MQLSEVLRACAAQKAMYIENTEGKRQQVVVLDFAAIADIEELERAQAERDTYKKALEDIIEGVNCNCRYNCEGCFAATARAALYP